MKQKLSLVFCMFLFVSIAFSQTTKFGDVTTKDFDPDYKALDSNAQAVVLYDAGRAYYESNNEDWFNVVYTYHYRVKLISKNAFDLATIEIPLYKGEKKEDEIKDLEAATYTLDNGVVTKVKVDKESIFKDKVQKDVVIKKFTFPNLKEGCIIEFKYKIISPRTYSLRSFSFQGRYPVMRSEYEVSIPELFKFVFFTNGYYNLNPVEVSNSFKSFRLIDRSNPYASPDFFSYDATLALTKWVLTNVKPIKKEGFITATKNHTSRIEFILSSLNFPKQPAKPQLKSWQETAKDLLKDEQFGLSLSEKNKWLDDEVERLTAKKDSLTTAKNIFKYVKENFLCTDHSAWFIPTTLKKAF